MSETKAKILIVEDDYSILKIIQFNLEKEGFEIKTALNGTSALSILETWMPDLIISDIMMPEMDGFEFLTSLKKLNFEKDIPFLFLSAKDDIDDKIQGLNLGAFKYLTKPFKVRELLRAINDLLQTHVRIKLQKHAEDWISIKVNSKAEYLKEIKELISAFVKKRGVSNEIISKIEYVLLELGTNAIEHGNVFDISKEIEIALLLLKDKVIIKISDEGFGFDHKNIADLSKADLFKHIQKRTEQGKRPGGFGIYLCKQLSDKIEYNIKGNTVLVTIRAL